ncbi:ectonucleotide pyrophosphatase/phosphodiesterase family member 7-like [Ptychodera flava]|uniref:ectonucleotide pyrophosphatase/phosphodiesterase family member 7-like n=1 Tax=Ptychodera flava TaxID=63121 RepID=UPI00396A5E26
MEKTISQFHFTLILCLATRPLTTQAANKLLLVLLDGFRYDLYGNNLSSFAEIAKRGVRANYAKPVFPSFSSPCMYSIATGLWVESHGVVHNSYYNASTGETYDFFQTQNITEWWDTGAEPVWVTGKLQGLTAGSYAYPGGSVPVKGILPDKVVYSTLRLYLTNLNERIDTVIGWIADDDIDITFLYYNLLDDVMHVVGQPSPAGDSIIADKILSDINDDIHHLLEKLEERDLFDKVNVLYTADHGHVEVEGQIKLFDYISEDDLDFYLFSDAAFTQLLPKEGKLEQVYQALDGAHPHMHVYKKEEMPEHLHYSNNERILPLVVIADPPFQLMTADRSIKSSEHGYDYMNQEMWTMFYAHGPSFKKGYEAKGFQSVDIYPLMCEILDIKPAPNNGSLDNVKDMILDTAVGSAVYTKPSTWFPLVFILQVARYRKI